MLNITIIAVGKLKEKYWTQAVMEYSKRLGSSVKLNIIEVKDEPSADRLSEGEVRAILSKEAERIAVKTPKRAFTVALCVEGKELSSEELADKIKSLTVSGVGHIAFIIGGSLGLDEELKNKADLKLSFSKMTFPHQLMRVILLEQIYRATCINSGKTYHK